MGRWMRDPKKEHWTARVKPKTVVAVAWCIGVPISIGLFVWGYVGDQRGFWESRPYFTNILTALTGAGVGVPFAISVVNWLSRLQAEVSQWSGTYRYALQLVASLRRSIWPNEDFDETTVGVGQLLGAVRGLRGDLEGFDPQIRGSEYGRQVDGGGFTSDGSRVRKAHPETIEALRRQSGRIRSLAMRNLLEKEEAERASVQFNADWQVFDRAVRPVISQTKGTDWMPVHAYGVLSKGKREFLSSDEVLSVVTQIEKILASDSLGFPYGLGYDYQAPLVRVLGKLGELVEVREAVLAVEATLSLDWMRSPTREHP